MPANTGQIGSRPKYEELQIVITTNVLLGNLRIEPGICCRAWWPRRFWTFGFSKANETKAGLEYRRRCINRLLVAGLAKKGGL